MLDAWRNIKKVNFGYHNQNGNFRTTLPFCCFEIVGTLKILDYLYREEKENSFKFDQFNEDQEKAFLVRIMSYVMFVTELERIIGLSFDRTKKYFKSIGFIKKENDENIKENMEEEVKDFRFWRNKVFAHTSFSSSNNLSISTELKQELCSECKRKIKDKISDNKVNLSTQITSLKYFYGGYLTINSKGFALGGIHTSVNGECPKEQFLQIDILNSHLKLIEHYKNWANIFNDLMIEFEKMDMELIKTKYNIESIEFRY